MLSPVWNVAEGQQLARVGTAGAGIWLCLTMVLQLVGIYNSELCLHSCCSANLHVLNSAAQGISKQHWVNALVLILICNAMSTNLCCH